jgi:SP family facilitated glucose transporter-like MFS transporter 8
MSTIIIGAMLFLSSCGGCFFVDRVGRRVLLLVSIIIMTLTLIALGTFFFIQSVDEQTAESLGWLPLTSLCIYILAFPFGFGGVSWLVVSEVAPKNIKAFCGPIIGFFAWALTFLITLSFTNVIELFGSGPTFWIFAGFSVVGIFFTYFVVPETKGRTLAEIENSLNKKD